jgi:hypothetical protein
VALVRTGVSEEPGASFIRVTKICELGTTQAATSVTTEKTPFFTVTAVKTSNLTNYVLFAESRQSFRAIIINIPYVRAFKICGFHGGDYE